MRLPHAALLTALIACYLPWVTASPADAHSARAQTQKIHYKQWDSGAELAAGRKLGTVVTQGRIKIGTPTGKRNLGGYTYEQAAWESPWVTPGFSFTELIASWSALTPGNSYIEVRVRGRNAAGTTSSWDQLARWTSSDKYLKRTTFGSQDDDLSSVNVDTLDTSGMTSYQLRVTLARRAGSTMQPSIDTIGAVSSRLPATAPPTSEPGPGRGIVLNVPKYSQMIHQGHYPQWGGGGEAWCSPTSTSMVLGYYKKLPDPKQYSWVNSGHTNPWVDYAARSTYDHRYDGTGNWPFNTAFAAPRVGKGFITRLRSLREAERFIADGIPLVASISFKSGELDGAPINSTAGHLLVIVGFTASGDVVVNDPAGRVNSEVRRTYNRSQFERLWLNASGGLVYVIHDAAHPLPDGQHTNW